VDPKLFFSDPDSALALISDADSNAASLIKILDLTIPYVLKARIA
jgi:hypothetical protein